MDNRSVYISVSVSARDKMISLILTLTVIVDKHGILHPERCSGIKQPQVREKKLEQLYNIHIVINYVTRCFLINSKKKFNKNKLF